MRRAYILTDDQADWIADLLRMAADPDSGVVDTTSGGGYRGTAADDVFTFLNDTAQSVTDQRGGDRATEVERCD